MIGPTIENDYPFLVIDEEAMIIYLRPKVYHEPGVYTASKIIFSMDRAPGLTLNVKIEATIKRCVVNSV